MDKKVNEMIKEFSAMVDYGFLGVYKRQKISEQIVESKFVPALTKACSMGAFLNRKYELYKDFKGVLPEIESELFNMFEHPLADIIDNLPEKYSQAIKEKTYYYDLEPLIETFEKGNVIITEEGYIMLSDRKIYASKDEADQIGEYNGQLIFEELCKGDYVKNRKFLEDRANVYIPENVLMQSDEQREFIKTYQELFDMCYVKNTRLNLFRCKCCGMVLRECKTGVFSCVSKKCNYKIDEKTAIEMHGPGWVMRDIVARNIYYPGQLEQEIISVLEKGKRVGTVKDYDLWPGNAPGKFDTWDFRVYMSSGKIYLIDAKDVENPHWIINDKREFVEGTDFLYTVPNDKSKTYLDQINNHVKCKGKLHCLRLKELKNAIGV